MTSFIIKNANRILIKENGEEINMNDGDIIQYTGHYYKHVNDIVNMVTIETTFIGVVETCRFRYDTGIEGIYVKPSIKKYFVYPHLLMLSRHNNYPSCYYPIFSLNTCENKSLDEFINIQKTFDLCEFL